MLSDHDTIVKHPTRERKCFLMAVSLFTLVEKVACSLSLIKWFCGVLNIDVYC